MTSLVILCFGLAVGGLLIFQAVQSFSAGRLLKADFPGTETFRVEEAGKLRIWHHDPATYEAGGPAELPAGTTIKITEKASGKEIPTSPATASLKVQVGSDARKAWGSFEVPQAGDYSIQVNSPEPLTLSVTYAGIGSGLMGMVLGIIAMVAAALLALFIGLFSYFSRSKRRSEYWQDQAIPSSGN